MARQGKDVHVSFSPLTPARVIGHVVLVRSHFSGYRVNQYLSFESFFISLFCILCTWSERNADSDLPIAAEVPSSCLVKSGMRVTSGCASLGHIQIGRPNLA